ncbi:NAD(P)-dependent dehydrogenase, short-chain alcohol dehydrogenase family [Daejeonella rubra]|uniref:NAD(P)-dependent dehydrogenase, short-chain alcohol dehydrogenase family n=1 Tax=Daejeonella rubra TaxID=990371 RepID=A0A1G9WVG5_9SPHI|nr:SDR family oxidoreductase [Daejeonella rubra]SDM88261.1 NAD(P)-dependent dehydrogenase, short-chain alcohol dehydrogenase family [Daejeonella rubra]
MKKVNMKMLFDVSREIVLITGVSGQLGRTYARTFLESGAIVVGLDLVAGNHSEILESEYRDKFFFCVADVTSKSSLELALEEILLKIGVPTVLINNAAIDSPPGAPIEETGPFETYPEASWDKVMDVNVKGVFLASQIFGAEMARNNKGSIINISSIYGVVSPDQSIYEYRRLRGETFYKPVAYSASKSAILNLTKYLAVYWAKNNVRVNTLVIAGVENNQDADFKKAYCGRIPIGRMATEQEYNGALIFLSSSASQYMTGSQLVVDGGWTSI